MQLSSQASILNRDWSGYKPALCLCVCAFFNSLSMSSRLNSERVTSLGAQAERVVLF